MESFKIASEFAPSGDQPKAIESLVKGANDAVRSQVLLGVTGSGKTFTMANIVERLNRPALVLAHNKTLAAQLYEEFKELFPNNAVEYFVSYYDYYQPEAYIARSDTYIEKDMSINEKIEKMRLSATRSLIERRDTLVVSSVSCIYGLGSPEYYRDMNEKLFVGKRIERDDLLLRFIDMHYKRNDLDLSPGTFRVRGDVVEVFPAYEEKVALRLEFFDDEIERITLIDPLINRSLERVEKITLYPASHYVVPEEVREGALKTIREELKEREAFFEAENLLVEAQRIGQRTRYDIEMIKEIGFCKGIENYSRHFSGRRPGEPSPCLIDYFPDDFLIFVDESHQTIPQIHAMYNGDRARKVALVDYGFRLPSAFDNRPLKFDEFYNKINQVIYVSATPGPWEIQEAKGVVVEQVIRPTGLLDPEIEVRPAKTQVDDALSEIHEHTKKGGRVLVTTLTKRLAEELSNYLNEIGVKAKYLHSDIDTLERSEIILDLRKGNFDVLVGINLLREGLDIPEVSLVAILDADKQGFLRSTTALVQTCGRAARNAEGRVIMYADKTTDAIAETLRITKERRAKQDAYNKEHGITPKSTARKMSSQLADLNTGKEKEFESEIAKNHLSKEDIEEKINFYRKAMKQAAKEMQFEDAAAYRDKMLYYEQMEISKS
jgi:excinuclease ABC subunit B